MWVFSRLLGSYELLCGVPWWCLMPSWPSLVPSAINESVLHRMCGVMPSQNVLLHTISHDPTSPHLPANQKEITIVSPIFKMTLPGGAGSRHDVRKSAKRPLASLSLLIMKHSDYKLTAG